MGSGKRLGGKELNFTLDFEEVDGMPKIGITIKLEHMKALFNMAISDWTQGSCSYLGKSYDSVIK